MVEYTRAQEIVSNLPYMAMIGLGVLILVVGSREEVKGWLAGGAYLAYGVAGALWIMVFLCPYCPHWNTRSCPCGYGRIAAKLREKKEADHFKAKFRKHIAVIVPLWFIPVLAGIFLLARSFSSLLLILLVAFAIDAFVVLPLVSRKHGCVECPQSDSCPWMERRNCAK